MYIAEFDLSHWGPTMAVPIPPEQDTALEWLQASRDAWASSDRRYNRSSLILYTTAEPCPMCQGAILWSGMETVVFGTSIRSLQKLGYRQIDILAEEVVRRSPAWKCTILGGVLEEACDALFELAMLQRNQPT